MRSRVVRILAVLLCVAAPAAGQGKTDVITLQNGDRITGEIKSLSRGRLKLETDDAGTIEIEWDNILQVRSAWQFDVVTVDGRRLFGSLGGTTARTVVITLGNETTTLPIPEVNTISRIGASFWTKLEGSVSAGFSYTQSSGIAQTTFNSDTQFRQPLYLVRLTGAATVTEQEDQEDDDRASMSLSYERYRGTKWFLALAGRLENNESLGLVLRSQVGGVLGQRLVRTNRAQFQAGAGVVGNNEEAVSAESTQNIEGILTAQASYYTYDGRKTTIDAAFAYYPSMSQAGRQRLQIDSSLKRDIVTDLIVSLSLYYTFDSDPPETGAERTDVGIVTSIGWSFGG